MPTTLDLTEIFERIEEGAKPDPVIADLVAAQMGLPTQAEEEDRYLGAIRL